MLKVIIIIIIIIIITKTLLMLANDTCQCPLLPKQWAMIPEKWAFLPRMDRVKYTVQIRYDTIQCLSAHCGVEYL